MAYKAPEVLDKYLNFHVENFNIYISKVATTGTNHIHFRLRGFWIFKTLVAEGLQFPRA